MLNKPAWAICPPCSAKLFHFSLKFTKEIPEFSSPGSLRKIIAYGFSQQQHLFALLKTSSNGSPLGQPNTAIPPVAIQNKRWIWRTPLQPLWKITHPSLGSECLSWQSSFNMVLNAFQLIQEYHTFETLWFYFLSFTDQQQPSFFSAGSKARKSSH